VKARDGANRAVSGVEVASEAALPGATVLLSPAPNPMRGTATVTYTLARAGAVELEVYGVDGRRVRRLAGGEQGAGVYRVTWDGRDGSGGRAAAGVYYVRLVAAGQRFTRTLVLLR
jgi:flagellar hook assembly protein FlgD